MSVPVNIRLKIKTVVYVVYVYADYRKEVEIDVIRVFLKKEDALAFAEKFLSDHKKVEHEHDDEHDDGDNTVPRIDAEYVTAHHTTFDKPVDTYTPSDRTYGYFHPRIAIQEVVSDYY